MIYIPFTNRAGWIGPIESLWVLFLFIYYFLSNYSVAQPGLGLGMAGLWQHSIPGKSTMYKKPAMPPRSRSKVCGCGVGGGFTPAWDWVRLGYVGLLQDEEPK